MKAENETQTQVTTTKEILRIANEIREQRGTGEIPRHRSLDWFAVERQLEAPRLGEYGTRQTVKYDDYSAAALINYFVDLERRPYKPRGRS